MLLHFLASGTGTTLYAQWQTALGDLSPMKPKIVEEFAQAIRREIAFQAEAFLAFRSLFGWWMTPASYMAASPARLASRIQTICGLAPDKAQSWSDKILKAVRT